MPRFFDARNIGRYAANAVLLISTIGLITSLHALSSDNKELAKEAYGLVQLHSISFPGALGAREILNCFNEAEEHPQPH